MEELISDRLHKVIGALKSGLLKIICDDGPN
jgi:hypothetical protein